MKFKGKFKMKFKEKFKRKFNQGNQLEAILVGGTMGWKGWGNPRGRVTEPYL